jgi:hypothetical protein
MQCIAATVQAIMNVGNILRLYRKNQLSLAIFDEILAVGSVDRIRQITKYLSGTQKASTGRLGFAQSDKDGKAHDFIFTRYLA